MVLEEKEHAEVINTEDYFEKGADCSLDIADSIRLGRILLFLTAIAVLVFFFLTLYCVPQVFLMYFGYQDSQVMFETVVSPFDSIVEEYSPKSSKPCVYSTLEYPYENTYLCNCKYLIKIIFRKGTNLIHSHKYSFITLLSKRLLL